MKEYYIEFTHDDMPAEFKSACIKWAHNPKQALQCILRKTPNKDGSCQFKKGGSGRITLIEELKSGDDRVST